VTTIGWETLELLTTIALIAPRRKLDDQNRNPNRITNAFLINEIRGGTEDDFEFFIRSQQLKQFFISSVKREGFPDANCFRALLCEEIPEKFFHTRSAIGE
jgi:hypothetical protein